MTRLVFAILMALAVMMVKPANAQNLSAGYDAAEQIFNSLSQEQRIRIQILLSASGYWFNLPNERFSENFFEALKAYQADNGLAPDGRISQPLLDRLLLSSEPYLTRWGFAETSLPNRKSSIWFPAGLGLIPERTSDTLSFKDPDNKLNIYIVTLQSKNLEQIYDTTLKTIKDANSKLIYTNVNSDFFIISYSDGVHTGYWQGDRDEQGIISFHVRWDDNNQLLAGKRIVAIMTGSLAAAVDRMPFVRPFNIKIPLKEGQSSSDASPGPDPARQPSPRAQKSEPQTVSSGTGFFVNAAGHLLTNAHVVGKCRRFAITPSGGEMVPARLVAIDVANDLALLKADATPDTIAMIRTNVKLGEPIAVFGYPLTTVLSRNGNFTLGNVTALAGLNDDSNQLQISAPVQPGNSGGPLVDRYGNLVGVVVSKLNAVKVAEAVGDVPQNVNFAIKASVAVNFLSSNGISHAEEQPATTVLDPVALADKAKSISAFILCK